MTHPSWTSQTVSTYLTRLGSPAPTPGGGSAACLAGALGADLGSMVLSVAQKRSASPEAAGLQSELLGIEDAFLRLAQEDEEAFGLLLDVSRLATTDPTRSTRLEDALERAASVPLRAAALARDLLRSLRAVAAHAPDVIVSDVGIGAHLAWASLRSSLLNVSANLHYAKSADLRARLSDEWRAIEKTSSAVYRDTIRVVAERLGETSPSQG